MNWNTARSAIRAAAAYRNSCDVRVRVTIIDNHSRPPDQEVLTAGVPARVELVLAGRNLGFGAAANRALNDTDAELVCVSNPDLAPAPDMLACLAEAVMADRSVGLAAPRLEGGGDRYHAKLPRAATLPLRAFAGSFGHRTVADPPRGVVLEVEQPAGACLVARTETWRRLGGFDPGFFLWFEDVDLARRSLNAGFSNLVVGSAVARHAGAEAFAQVDSAEKQAIRLRSLERYVAKHHPRMRGATRAAIAIARPLRARGSGGRSRTAMPPSDLEQQ